MKHGRVELCELHGQFPGASAEGLWDSVLVSSCPWCLSWLMEHSQNVLLFEVCFCISLRSEYLSETMGLWPPSTGG